MNITNTTNTELVRVYKLQQAQLSKHTELWQEQVELNKELGSCQHQQSTVILSTVLVVLVFWAIVNELSKRV